MQPASWAPLTAFATALLAVWWLARGRFSGLVLDHPSHRSLHAAPVPRTGGLGLHAGIVLAAGIAAPGLPGAFWVAYGALLAVSLLDDVRGLPAAVRLAAHLAAGAYFAASVMPAEHGPVALAGAALAIAWMTNLYNFMDGSDGLAGGMALIGFACFGAAAWSAHGGGLALLAFSIAAAAAAFLVFNFHPARIFLGDAGSVPLGFLAAALGLTGWLRGDWPAWFPVLVFAPFIADATVTLLRRLARGERVWQAHRDHYYQRLVRMGWGHRRTALAAYALMLASGGVALAALAAPDAARAMLLGAAALAYPALGLVLERAWRRYRIVNRQS